MGWFYLFLARLAMGERWRKATLIEKSYGAALFFLIPLGFELLIFAMKYHITAMMDTASATALWLGFTFCSSLLVFTAVFWGKHVPIKVSVALAIVAWLILASTVVHYDFLSNLHDR